MHTSLAAQRSGNVTKTWFLMGIFLCLVVGIGYVLSQYTASISYLYGAVAISFAMNIFAYFNADKIALSSAHAQLADEKVYAQLHAIIGKLAIEMNIPKPSVYIVEDDAPNAFATGRSPQHASVAATTGLLKRLNDKEIEGVFAHELSHVANRDILVMTVAVVLTGCISILANAFIRTSMMRSNEREGSNPLITIASLLALVLAPIAAQLLQLAVSRKREYLADATGALLTQHPENLASALQKIAQYTEPMQTASLATAHLYISNPFGAHSAGKFLKNIFSTHPPIEDRINILRSSE